MFYNYNGTEYLLNLIDTPGHIDFSYEVSRSLSACQGCLLVVDATQGIQAQTIANFYLAFESGLYIVPVINKIDLKTAKLNVVIEQLKTTLDFSKDDIIPISAKQGINCEAILKAVIEKIPK
jgi:small GTP-binding protein